MKKIVGGNALLKHRSCKSRKASVSCIQKKTYPRFCNGIESTIETAKIAEFVCLDMLK